MPYKIALYIRVSTEEQAMRTEGSLESQKYRLNGFVDIKNMQQTNWGTVVETFLDEGLSAKDTKRPALQRMLKDLRKGRVDMVLVTDISRLSRSIRDFCELIDIFKETKTQFLSLKEQFDTTTAAGEMMLFNMINLAQFERRQISERVTLNFHSRAMRGLRNGGSAILGFEVDPTNKSTLKVNNDEALLVKKIFDTYTEEGSLYKTAEKLRELQIPFKNNSNGNWNVQTLRNLLRNQSYIGIKEVNKGNKSTDPQDLTLNEKYQTVKASWPAIVDESTFNIVQKMLDENAKNERLRLSDKKSRIYLVSGIATCGECGRALVGSAAHGRVNVIRYYNHRPIEGQPVTCSTKRIQAELVENIITNHLLHVMHREGYLDGIEGAIANNLSGEREQLQSQKNETQKKLSELDADIKKLIRLQIQTEDLTLQNIYSEQLLETKNQRQTQFVLLESVSRKLDETPRPCDIRDAVEVNLKRLQAAWDKASPKMQKSLIRAVVDRLIFNSNSIDIYYRPITEKASNGQEINFDGFTRENLVNLSSRRKKTEVSSKNNALEDLSLGHNEKISGSYVVKIGCGSRI